MLATYNMLQISKLETTIETQQRKTDLLTNIMKLHEQHLYKLDEMVDDIGNELQVIKLRQTFQVSVKRVVAQIMSDENKLWAVVAMFERIIVTAFNQKIAPGALSTDLLSNIANLKRHGPEEQL